MILKKNVLLNNESFDVKSVIFLLKKPMVIEVKGLSRFIILNQSLR